MLTNFDKGIKAEKVVAKFISSAGFKIIQHRYVSPYGEIDLIAANKNLLLFCEVKSRSKCLHKEVLCNRQVKRITKSAEYFLMENPQYNNFNCRFDFVLLSEDKIIEYIQNAWEAYE